MNEASIQDMVVAPQVDDTATDNVAAGLKRAGEEGGENGKNKEEVKKQKAESLGKDKSNHCPFLQPFRLEQIQHTRLGEISPFWEFCLLVGCVFLLD